MTDFYEKLDHFWFNYLELNMIVTNWFFSAEREGKKYQVLYKRGTLKSEHVKMGGDYIPPSRKYRNVPPEHPANQII